MSSKASLNVDGTFAVDTRTRVEGKAEGFTGSVSLFFEDDRGRHLYHTPIQSYSVGGPQANPRDRNDVYPSATTPDANKTIPEGLLDATHAIRLWHGELPVERVEWRIEQGVAAKKTVAEIVKDLEERREVLYTSKKGGYSVVLPATPEPSGGLLNRILGEIDNVSVPNAKGRPFSIRILVQENEGADAFVPKKAGLLGTVAGMFGDEELLAEPEERVLNGEPAVDLMFKKDDLFCLCRLTTGSKRTFVLSVAAKSINDLKLPGVEDVFLTFKPAAK